MHIHWDFWACCSDSEDTMPADIRNFFGGKPSQGSGSSPAKPPAKKEVCCYSRRVHYDIAKHKPGVLGSL